MLELSIRFPHLGIYLEQVGRNVSIGDVEIPLYGICVAAGLLVGMWFAIIEAKRTHQDPNLYLDMLILSTGAALLGSRLYYVLFSWSYYREHPAEILDVRQGGLAIYGGLLCGALAAWLFARLKKQSFWQFGDTICVGLLTGQIIGRLGDFFNREAFGEYTDSLFAMQLPVSSVRPFAITAQMREHLVQIQNVDFIQAHPIFLYEILWNLALLFLLMHCRRKKRFHGELFLIYLAGYSLGRCWMDGLRADPLLTPWLSLPASQLLAALLTIGCTVTILVKREMARRRKEAQKSRREAEAAPEETEPLSTAELSALQEELAQENTDAPADVPTENEMENIKEEAASALKVETATEMAEPFSEEAAKTLENEDDAQTADAEDATKSEVESSEIIPDEESKAENLPADETLESSESLPMDDSETSETPPAPEPEAEVPETLFTDEAESETTENLEAPKTTTENPQALPTDDSKTEATDGEKATSLK